MDNWSRVIQHLHLQGKFIFIQRLFVVVILTPWVHEHAQNGRYSLMIIYVTASHWHNNE